MLVNDSKPMNTVIDLDQQQELYKPFQKKMECYFGKVRIQLKEGELQIELHLKDDPDNNLNEDDIQLIDKDQYEITQPILLYISNNNLTKPLRLVFGNIGKLAQYLTQFTSNSKYISVHPQKLRLNVNEIEKNPSKVVDLYYDNFKKIDKQDLLREYKKLDEAFSANSIDMSFIDPQLILAAPGFSEEDLLELYRDDDQSASQESDQQEEREDQSQEHTSDINQSQAPSNGEGKDNISFASQLEPNYHQTHPSSGHDPSNPKIIVQKQNQIPIYERFRGIDINIPRKQKIRLAQKMLRIGYSKQDIIRFFGGGAEEMQAQGNRLPDYRNPQSARYKQIHLKVAKKQHERHNLLLKRYGLPPVPQLPEYAREIVTLQNQARDRKIKEMLIRLIRQKKFKKLHQIQEQMRKNQIEVTLSQLKKHVQELKRRSSQKKQLQKEREDYF